MSCLWEDLVHKEGGMSTQKKFVVVYRSMNILMFGIFYILSIFSWLLFESQIAHTMLYLTSGWFVFQIFALIWTFLKEM